AGRRILDPELCDGAQEALDHVVRMLDELGHGQPLGAAPDGLMVRLNSAEHGGAASRTSAAPAPAAVKPATPAASGKDEITDAEFEALLDQLEGKATVAAAPAAPPAAVEPAPAASAPAAA